ncbi:MAG: hypothetical protein KF747_09525 [Nitrospira sp.]|nr:hypothetical protein [Nitrospira sp.]
MATVVPTVIEYIHPLDKNGKVLPDCSPYLHELALLVVVWNELHMELSQLFCIAAGMPDMGTGLRIWHSTGNDRAQREFLREALHGDLQHLRRVKEKGKLFADKAKEEIKFILKTVDTISGPRNDAIHSSYLFKSDGKRITMCADDFFMSPRAKNLSGKDLLVEFQRQRSIATTLSIYSQGIRLALYLVPEPPWPARPKLPTTNKAPQKSV